MSTMSSLPTSFYAIPANEDHDSLQNFMAPINACPNMGGESLSPTTFNLPAPSFPNANNISATHEELPAFLKKGVTDVAGLQVAPVFPTNSAIPHFQAQIPYSLLSSLFCSKSPTFPENTLVPTPGPSCRKLPKHHRKPKDIYTKLITAYLSKTIRVAYARRTRVPTRNTGRRSYGAGFQDMIDGLPDEVQDALNTFYTGCCESVTDRDNSTLQKHMLSKRHCRNLPGEYLAILPCFVCPAYVALHSECKRANGGRYDSTYRHCKNCAGFKEMNSKCQIFPLEITNGEHEAIRKYRNNEMAEDEEKNERLVNNSVDKLLRMMVRHEDLQIHEAEPNFSEAIHANVVSPDAVGLKAAVGQVGATFTPEAC